MMAYPPPCFKIVNYSCAEAGIEMLDVLAGRDARGTDSVDGVQRRSRGPCPDGERIHAGTLVLAGIFA